MIKGFTLLLLMFAIVGCAAIATVLPVTPDVTFDRNLVKEKIPLNVAVVISESIAKHLMSSCCSYKNEESEKYLDWAVGINSAKTSLNLFKEAFPALFENVVFYELHKLQTDLSQYDLVIFTNVSCYLNITKSKKRTKRGTGLYQINSSVNYKFRFKTDSSSYLKLFQATGFDERQVVVDEIKSFGKLVPYLINLDCKKSVGIAIESAFSMLIGKIVSSDELKKYANSIRLQETLPANLIAQVQYLDINSINPNQIIDAAEESYIQVSLANEGRGTAFDVKLITESNIKNIEFPRTIPVGDIQPDETKEIKVRLKANLELDDGTALFVLYCQEKRGYDSKKYQLNILTSRLEKPEIVIANYKLNDGATGLASGNGNGIPENGETIELIPFVKNNGVGKAIQVKLSIDSINQGLDIKRESVSIPQIQPGQTTSGSLSFSIPRTYTGGEIKVNLIASDVRGAAEARRLYAISMQSHRPVLAYTYKIIDRNRNSFVESGEEGEIELYPSNTGKMDAKDIEIKLNSNDLLFTKTEMTIEHIAANSKYVPLRFAFKVPRTIEKESVNVRVEFEQKDFAGLTDRINIPIRLTIPDFQITHQILDANNDGVIEQGETVDLIVKVRNTGGLDANGVVLSMLVDSQSKIKEGIILDSNRQVSLGRIAAGKSSEPQYFKLVAQARAETGEVPIQFTITQADFSKKDVSLALNIAPEKPEVITVAGHKKQQETRQVAATTYNTPPLIAIALPKNNKRVASASEILSGIVADDKGVAGIEIYLNGRRLDVSRGIAVEIGQNQREQDFNIKVPLQIGRNEIRVTAFDIENLSSSKIIAVYREKQRGEIWAAVIGINHYQNPQIPALKYARNDAKAFANYLRTNMGLEQQHLFEMYDSQATYRKLRSLLGTKISRQADSPEDTVFIYFAGHGAPEKDPMNRDGDGIEKYILTYDTDPNDLYGTALPMDEIAKIFNRIQAERVVFIADSCYSGESGGRTILAAGRRANLSEGFLERLAQGKGRIILTSSRANETSQESDKLGHGYFTYSLLEGLRGEADVSSDGLIDVDEIYLYLNRRVPEMTNGAQHPVKKGEAEGLVIVGRVK